MKIEFELPEWVDKVEINNLKDEEMLELTVYKRMQKGRVFSHKARISYEATKDGGVKLGMKHCVAIVKYADYGINYKKSN